MIFSCGKLDEVVAIASPEVAGSVLQKEIPFVWRHTLIAAPYPDALSIPPADRHVAVEPHLILCWDVYGGRAPLRNRSRPLQIGHLQVFPSLGRGSHHDPIPSGDVYVTGPVRS